MRLYLMQFGIQTGTGVPVPGYLIQTDDGQNILVDTGYPAWAVGAPAIIPDLAPTVDDLAVNRLAELGLAPADIDMVICSHFDFDHAGAHDQFPHAIFVVQRSHYDFARATDDQRITVYKPHWDVPGLRYEFVDGDAELLPGIELIESGGHVPGHQCVLLRLAETGPVLLAIDALPGTKQIDPATYVPSAADMDPAGALAAVEKLRSLIRADDVRLVICGHDAAQWRELRKAPDYYA